MKKKNVLMMALSLALVAVIAIGGTLAFLTATDDEVVNTFTFANDLKVALTEDAPDAASMGNASASPNGDKGYDYTNVVRNQELPKEPKIQLTEFTVDTYVFAKIINNTNGKVEVGAINSAWTPCGEDDNGNMVYGRKVEYTGEGCVDTATALFSTVTIVGEPDTGTSLGNITIQVSAIQATGFTADEEAGKTAMEVALGEVTQWETAE